MQCFQAWSLQSPQWRHHARSAWGVRITRGITSTTKAMRGPHQSPRPLTSWTMDKSLVNFPYPHKFVNSQAQLLKTRIGMSEWIMNNLGLQKILNYWHVWLQHQELDWLLDSSIADIPQFLLWEKSRHQGNSRQVGSGAWQQGLDSILNFWANNRISRVHNRLFFLRSWGRRACNYMKVPPQLDIFFCLLAYIHSSAWWTSPRCYNSGHFVQRPCAGSCWECHVWSTASTRV